MILHVSDSEFTLILDALVEKPCPYQVMMPLITSLIAQHEKFMTAARVEAEEEAKKGLIGTAGTLAGNQTQHGKAIYSTNADRTACERSGLHDLPCPKVVTQTNRDLGLASRPLAASFAVTRNR